MRRVAQQPLVRQGQRAVALVLCVVLTGCGVFGGKKVPRPCPPVLLLDGARELTRFRDGPGRDITDIEFQARLENFSGGCDYDDEEVTVDLAVDFVVERGPANAEGKAAFRYFVAIPSFFPRGGGKRVFAAETAFEGNRRRAVYHDELRLRIPMRADAPPDRTPIYVGLQLTPEQLRHNEARKVR